MDTSGSKPRIIVDDDWKTKVQAEKEQLRRQTESSTGESQQPAPAADEAAKEDHGQPLPPASFMTLVESLAAQALSTLGQIPGPDGKPIVDLGYAKHLIDTLGVIEEKTKGNLSRDEAQVLEQVLHDLRMLYVAVSRRT
jgi:hypothetical protein